MTRPSSAILALTVIVGLTCQGQNASAADRKKTAKPVTSQTTTAPKPKKIISPPSPQPKQGTAKSWTITSPQGKTTRIWGD